MKTLGMLGGMSWESTNLYYRWINEETRRMRGGLHSAPLVMISVDFQEIERLQHAGDWQRCGQILADHARRLQEAGAELLLICTNTMHLVAPDIEAVIDMPLLHIADATARRILDQGISTVGLLGTRFTMEEDFYRGRLQQNGLRVLIPGQSERDEVHRVIYDELCMGQVLESSRQSYLRTISTLISEGAEAIVAGCTEIGMLISSSDLRVPLFDTARIHAEEAVAAALG